jgi:endonuclease IV
LAKLEHDWAVKNNKSQYNVSDKQKQGDNQDSKNKESQKETVNNLTQLIKDANELNKKSIYIHSGMYDLNKDTLDSMVNIASKIDESSLSKETKNKLDDLKDDLNTDIRKDLYVVMPNGRKGKFLNKDKEFHSELEDKETLSDKIKFISDEYFKVEDSEDKSVEITGIEESFEKVKDMLVEITKEYAKNKATQTLNYKLF